MNIDSEPGQLPYEAPEKESQQVVQRQAEREPSLLVPALLGLGVVTLILGVLAFWLAGSVRRLEATAAQQQAAMATVQAQVEAEAARAAESQAASLATVQAVEAKLAQEQAKSAAYSRIVRANQLTNNALLELDRRPQAALLLAIESLRMQRENAEAPLAESVQRLRSILGATGGRPRQTEQETTALAVSSDERWIAAGDEAGAVRIWDLHKPDAAPQLQRGHEGPVFDLAFGANNDSVYTVGDDGTLRQWRVGANGEETAEISTGMFGTGPSERQSPLYVLAPAPDGSKLAAAGEDGVVRLWRTGAVPAEMRELRGHAGPVNTLAFSPDGRLLASAGNDGAIRLWNSNSAEQEVVLTAAENSTQGNFIHVVTFSPDGKWLASGSNDGGVRMWRVAGNASSDQEQATASVASIPWPGHDVAVYALSFSPDSRWLASADDGGEVRLWNVAQPGDNAVLGRHAGNVRGLAFAQGQSGPVLVSTGYDGEVRLWDYRNPDAGATVVRGHDSAINLLASPGEDRSQLPNLLVTAAYDRSLRVWHTDSPFAEPHQVLSAEPGVVDVAVSPDGTQLASYSQDGSTIQLWDARTGVADVTLGPDEVPVSAIAYSPSKDVLWVGSRDGSISAWNTQTAVLLHRFPGSDDTIATVAESPDGTLLASGGEDSKIRIWDSNSGELLRELAGHSGSVTGVAFTADGKTLISAGMGSGTLRIWDVATGAEKQVLQGPAEGLLDVAIQPNGPWLVGAGRDGAVWVWNADALAFEPARLSRHSTEVNAVNFSADGQVLASAGADGAVYLWSTVNPSAEPDALVGQGSSVNGVSFAPDGAWLASGSADGTIRLWSLKVDGLVEEACDTAGRNFTLEEWTQYFPTDVSSYRKTCPNLPGP
jgi:WD40 repeat protein